MNNNPSKEEIINQAIQFHLKGNIPEATKYYQYCINQGFENHMVLSNYGAILQNLGKLKQAELSYRKAIEINPNFAEAHSNLGNVLNALGKFKEAEYLYRKAIEINPNFSDAHSNLGNVLNDLGKFKEAEVYTRKAIEINPNFADAHSNLGNILNNLGKLKEAEVSTRKAIELNPHLAIAHSNLGNILINLGKFKEAEVYTRKAIEINPNFANAHSNLGNILNNLGKFKEAEVSTRKAIELNPHLAIAHSNLGNILIDLGKFKEAEVYTRKAIELNPHLAMAHSNLGNILNNLGKLKEAEVSTRKAIELNPHLAIAYSNLGNILIDLGKLKEAEVYTRKAIELDPNLAIAFYSLSKLKLSKENTIWRDQLFSKKILNNQLEKDQVNIYFARANILHKESNFKESSKYLESANNLKQNLNPSNIKYLLNKSKKLLFESNKENINENNDANFPCSIFIVGMPRSGSTLLESILSINTTVNDLGEKNILEESFLNWKISAKKLTLADLYLKKTNIYNEIRSTTNKWLYNYQYAGLIAQYIPNAKIIHCYRQPLDNILSIYRTHFAGGNEYSSSLVDCAKVYLDQEELMTKYKNRFRSKIYDLNYDLLVSNPTKEIKSLIRWLDLEWDDQYLSPHLNRRSVTTESNVQVRSPINSKSTGGWKNYKEMLKPAMEIITENNKFQDLIY